MKTFIYEQHRHECIRARHHALKIVLNEFIFIFYIALFEENAFLIVTFLSSDHSAVVPPDPIPNSEVKCSCADGSVGVPM